MVCQRCRGFLVCENFDDLGIETDSVNCVCIEDAVEKQVLIKNCLDLDLRWRC